MNKGELEILEAMFAELTKAPKEILPSKYWVELNKKNLDQLHTSKYENFKRTIALNYFTFCIGFTDVQMKYLMRNLPLACIMRCALKALFSPRYREFSFKHSLTYNLQAYLFWDFAVRQDRDHCLDKLSEPAEGNPPRIYSGDKMISQDLANSFLEYKSIVDSGIDTTKIKTIMKLGGGYGRTAFVFLSLLNSVRYIMVDLPPALYIAQKYLSSLFPHKNIFTFRTFSSYEDIEREIAEADIIFLLPTQLDFLPHKYADLFINISSFHEMRPDQIEYYFKKIDELTRHYFFFKQWKETTIPFENITLTENSYPIRETWSKIYWRECQVQTHFFEALFQV